MFTGIIEELGIVKGIEKKKNLTILSLRAKKVFKQAHQGDSLAVNGVCLTITDLKKDLVSFDLMKETLQTTNLKDLKFDNKVNLERALTLQKSISGHFVTGHIDGIGRIKRILKQPNYREFEITVPPNLKYAIIEKGSIAIEGVSLTIGKVKKDYFSVYLIPFTLKQTNLSLKSVGDNVNIETDILAKYILAHLGQFKGK